MKAVGRHILVEQEEQESVTASGIIIPQIEEQPRKSGVVISISNKLQDVEFKEGDVIFFDEYGAVPYEVEGKKLLAVPYDNIDAYNEQ